MKALLAALALLATFGTGQMARAEGVAEAVRPMNPGPPRFPALVRFYGVVYDLESGMPVAGAAIIFSGNSDPRRTRTTTDWKGRYVSDIARDRTEGLMITARAPGYRDGALRDTDPPLWEWSPEARRAKAAETVDDELGAVPFSKSPRSVEEVDLVLVRDQTQPPAIARYDRAVAPIVAEDRKGLYGGANIGSTCGLDGSYRGVVLDIESGKPVSFAKVVFVASWPRGWLRECETGESGKFGVWAPQDVILRDFAVTATSTGFRSGALKDMTPSYLALPEKSRRLIAASLTDAELFPISLPPPSPDGSLMLLMVPNDRSNPPGTSAAEPRARQKSAARQARIAVRPPVPEDPLPESHPDNRLLRIYGVVYDLESQRPIAGARVEFTYEGYPNSPIKISYEDHKRHFFQEVTDADGHYIVDLDRIHVERRDLFVSVRAEGYRTGALEDTDPPMFERAAADRHAKADETTDSDLDRIRVTASPSSNVVELDLVMLRDKRPAAR